MTIIDSSPTLMRRTPDCDLAQYVAELARSRSRGRDGGGDGQGRRRRRDLHLPLFPCYRYDASLCGDVNAPIPVASRSSSRSDPD